MAETSITVLPDSLAAARQTADLIANQIRDKPTSVLGLATGSTPIEVYRELIRRHRSDGLDCSAVTTFNLDEYVGLGPEHPQSYRHFMQENLFDHLNVPVSQTHVPDGLAADLAEHAERYEQAIAAAGGIDVQLLGIGHNGHIAFNEPGAARTSRTRVVRLAEQTIEKNSRFFASVGEVPRTALTMGIDTILESKQIVLLAFGKAKAEAVRRALQGPADSDSPASYLQLHENVTFVLDADAASLL